MSVTILDAAIFTVFFLLGVIAAAKVLKVLK